MEEGDPMIEPGTTYRYTFVAKPAGTRWYHAHAIAKTDFNRSLYTGQFGFFYIEPKNDPGRYDKEAFIALRQWERVGHPARPAARTAGRQRARSELHVGLVQRRALGFGDPIRVRQGQRVLFRLLNADATMDASIALPAHRFTVLALDGNPVPVPQTVDVL